MNLIDRILKRFGYIKVPFSCVIKHEKYDIEIVRLQYEVKLGDDIRVGDHTFKLEDKYEYDATQELLRQLVPFIQKRSIQNDIIDSNLRKHQNYELRIFVAKPKTQDQP